MTAAPLGRCLIALALLLPTACDDDKAKKPADKAPAAKAAAKPKPKLKLNPPAPKAPEPEPEPEEEAEPEPEEKAEPDPTFAVDCTKMKDAKYVELVKSKGIDPDSIDCGEDLP